ncbi:ATP-binding cassette domain-containing protein [Roseovarius faecimaris]|uniref:ATP-binding cassette domain-containing protein n=1 Tax=Roseovarius faecimaris TaxID=2494550 RepID=A0A6I6IXP6_9RHOB|nr:ATP-binding cassette domain-containing protein [Roseovarius faecimaris]QGY00267.1 ATP-binding cassette domain-containing protein [Roseovarius faecimaris]
MSMTLTDGLVKRRGKVILGPVSLELGVAGVTMVLGPNGAGKTTLLKVLHGVERLSGGRLHWSLPEEEARQSQAYVFQTPIMLRRTVAENLAYPLRLSGVGKAEIARRVEKWAGRIGLGDALERPAPRLSGGEKQKLALGRALIRHPSVVFLDEPCANLDGRSTREFETLLQQAQADGTRIIMTTHNIGQAKRLASDVVFLLGGAVNATAPAEDFFANPSTPEARAFLEGDILE